MLAALADRLNREAGWPAIPSLYFLTDPQRTPDPVAISETLPAGTAIVFRHFGAADRRTVADALARVCQRRGLWLLIAADPALADEVGADGVHWPERLLPARLGGGLVTASAHGRRGIARAAAAGADAVLLGPIFPSRSPSAAHPLGPMRAARLTAGAALPVIALGGVTARTGKRLLGRGFAGLAAIDGLVRA